MRLQLRRRHLPTRTTGLLVLRKSRGSVSHPMLNCRLHLRTRNRGMVPRRRRRGNRRRRACLALAAYHIAIGHVGHPLQHAAADHPQARARRAARLRTPGAVLHPCHPPAASPLRPARGRDEPGCSRLLFVHLRPARSDSGTPLAPASPCRVEQLIYKLLTLTFLTTQHNRYPDDESNKCAYLPRLRQEPDETTAGILVHLIRGKLHRKRLPHTPNGKA